MSQKTVPANNVVSLSAVINGINSGKRAVTVESVLMIIPFSDNLRMSDFQLSDGIRDDLISSKKTLSFESFVKLIGRDASGYSHGRKPAFRNDVSDSYLTIIADVLKNVEFNGKKLSHDLLANNIVSAINSHAASKKAEIKPISAKTAEIKLASTDNGKSDISELNDAGNDAASPDQIKQAYFPDDKGDVVAIAEYQAKIAALNEEKIATMTAKYNADNEALIDALELIRKTTSAKQAREIADNVLNLLFPAAKMA